LVALELFAYGEEMTVKPPLGFGWAARSPLTQKHVLRQYFGNLLFSAVLLLGPAALAVAFGPPLIGETAALWIYGILVGLFLLSLLVSTISVPFAWYHQRKSKRKVRDLITAMANTYSELSGDGQISARRLREVAARAADAGVVWPNPLFPILDDNIARTGRL
jgi:hypothetical protein